MWDPQESLPETIFWPAADQDDRLRAIGASLADVPGGFCMPWPGPQGPATLRQFTTIEEWRTALTALDLDPACAAPGVVRTKYRRAGRQPDAGNLAACHSCGLVPETSCEQGNRMLDRATLVGTVDNAAVGFLSALTPGAGELVTPP